MQHIHQTYDFVSQNKSYFLQSDKDFIFKYLVLAKLIFFGNIGQVKEMRKEYGKLNKMDMSIWECCELLNNVVDDSDPDLDEPQIQHLLQTAEAIRRDYPNEDWLHLTALIHGTCLVLLYHNDI